jgi:thiol-disulfide isomerase/thioredoxin
MKHIKQIIASCFIGLALSMSAQSNDNIIIIDGYFFYEVPVASSEITGISRISTSNGTKAFLITLSNPLPETALKYAISAEDIPESEELLEKAKNSTTTKITVASDSESKINIGEPFPQFAATDITGKTWSNADIQGKVMVLNLWFTGCGPCRAEMPELSQWKDEMPDVMFFSSTYEDANTAKPVIEKRGFNWIPLVNDTQFKEWVGSSGYPLTIVIDKNGKITHIEHGTSPVQRETLKQKIQEAR